MCPVRWFLSATADPLGDSDVVTIPYVPCRHAPPCFRREGIDFCEPFLKRPRQGHPRKHRPHLAGNADRCIRGWNEEIIGRGGGSGEIEGCDFFGIEGMFSHRGVPSPRK